MVAAVGRKIAKEHRARQIPHGKQTVKQLMRHGVSTNSLELSGDTAGRPLLYAGEMLDGSLLPLLPGCRSAQ